MFFIIILVVVIIILICYLFCLKKELKRVSDSIIKTKESDSNTIIHQELSLKELSTLINEINNLLKESNEAKIDYKRKNEILKKMMINISHDLRTPLTSALGYIDIILNSELPKKEQEKELKIIEERLKRLEELINSFFEFSKMTSCSELPELYEVNIIALLEESIAHYYEDYKKENREIEYNSSVIKYKMQSNKEMLIRIFDNLIGNAYKHSEGNLKIEIEDKENFKIVFINNLLYPNLDIDHIFDEFYTVDISRTKGNTGLGLAIVKEFTEQLGGKIYALKEKENLKITLEFSK